MVKIVEDVDFAKIEEVIYKKLMYKKRYDQII